MGEWVTHGECRCEHETPCLLRDGSPGLPYSSGEKCRRKQTKSVIKKGAYGGRNDCKKYVEPNYAQKNVSIFLAGVGVRKICLIYLTIH